MMNQKERIKNNYFYWICISISIFIITNSLSIYGKYDKLQVLQYDKAVYYSYLPSLFIYDDITLENPRKEIYKEEVKIFGKETGYNNKKSIKMTMGLAYAHLPFFLLADIECSLSGEYKNGFSTPYQRWIAYGQVIYLIIGLLIFGRLLKKYFDPKVVALTILTLTLSTNLFSYIVRDAGMAHGYLFSFSSIFMYVLDKFWEEKKIKQAIGIGLLFGWMFLIRPTMIVLAPLIILWGLKDTSFKNNFFFKKESLKFWIILVITSFIPIIPQLIYWKAVSGQFIYFSYVGEKFFWTDPQLINYVFSYKNGWFIYTPVMIFALIGLILLYLNKKLRPLLLTFLSMVFFYIYVNSCWWNWWFGGAFGARSMIELYAVMAFGLANLYMIIYEKLKKLSSGLIISFISIFSIINIYQTYQADLCIIHYDAMTKDAFWYVFMKPKKYVDYKELDKHLRPSTLINALNGYRDLDQVNGEEIKK